MEDKEILGYECKHAILCPSKVPGGDDLTLIKEVVHYKGGAKEIKLKTIRNYKRPFFITKKDFRNHTDKKEYELKNKLQEFSATESNLVTAIGRAIGTPGLNTTLKRICRNQYVYGADISSTAIIKHDYQTRWPDLISPNTVAALDIETDVLTKCKPGEELPIMVALTFGNKRIISIVESFLGTIVDPAEKLRKLFSKYLSQYENPETELIIDISPTPGTAIKRVMEQAHIWKPDFISIWNINFDVPKMNDALEREGIRLEDVYCDPCIPAPIRHAKYIKGPNQKRKSNGDITPIHWTEQWHTMQCASSFYFIDSGCVYRRIRIAKGMEDSYKLDDILNKNLGIRKLAFDDLLENEAPHLRSGTLAWHQFMQENYKLEYAVYNLFDCISLEELDKKTKDLSLTMAVLCEHSDYSNFSSQPRRIVDDLHFFVQNQPEPRIMATTSDQMTDENDELVIGMNGWITTLPAHLVDDNGLKCIKELPNVSTGARIHVYDLDVAGTYPNVEYFMNISKETTFRELSAIRDVPENIRRSIGINLTGGVVNAYEICCNVYKLPTFNDLLNDFIKE